MNTRHECSIGELFVAEDDYVVSVLNGGCHGAAVRHRQSVSSQQWPLRAATP